MEIYRSEDTAFVRLEPGERLIESLIEFARAEAVEFATITSGVGMVDGLELGFFCIPKNDYDTRKIEGVHDLSSISGNIALFEGQPRPHVHLVVNRPDYATISGHLIECATHITMEIGLKIITGSNLRRIATTDRPATRITREF